MLLVLLIALVSVVVVVRESLHLSVTERANASASEEVIQFRTFVDQQVDPRTDQPFASAERLLEAYLEQHQPDSDEVMVGYVGTRGRVFESYGPGAPPVEEYDLTADEGVLEAAARSPSGTAETTAGEMRWARTVIDGGTDPDALLVVGAFTRDARTQVERTVSTLALVSFGALLFAGVISWLVAGRILRPVRLVHEAADEITEQDLTRRIDVGDDDVSDLASTFNRMLDRLEEAFLTEQRFVDDAGVEPVVGSITIRVSPAKKT